jgi:Zn-dependent protease with chaperone function
MDTAFKRAFSSLEKPFKLQLFYGHLIYRTLCLLFVLSIGLISFYHYSFFFMKFAVVAFICGYFFYQKALIPYFIDRPTSDADLLHHQNVVESSPRAEFLMDVINHYACKLNLKKPFRLKMMTSPDILNVGVSSSKTDHLFIFSSDFFDLSKNEIYAIVGHELSHIVHGDVPAKYRLNDWYRWSMLASMCHIIFLNLSYFNIWMFLLILLVFSLFFILSIFVELYISRRQEYLADIGSVKLTGQGHALVTALTRVHEINQMHVPPKVMARVHELGLSTHPEYKSRKAVLLQAQKIYDQFNKPIGLI